jgi:hypothetical protein
VKPHLQQPATGDTIGANTGIENALAPADGKAHPEERYRDELVRLPAQEDAASALLREVLAGGANRGWKLVSALREPDGEAFLLTWDTSGYFSG